MQKIWIALWDGVITGQMEHAYKTEDARLLSMVEFLQKNYQKKFVLDELCSCVNFSRSACCRYFRKMMDMSITEYLTEYRLSQALVMLGSTDKSITEIALSSGFATASYFGSRFKEKMRMTPLEYRMKERGRELQRDA
ncbi:MAG: helix-turn-helix transcriptional regulator [Lachnospiraceae bacterium]|nr:helix-turn-helix transcriptional regulator [Lachnospiraceae bacterium]